MSRLRRWDTAASFVTWSVVGDPADTSFGGDDLQVAELTSATNLQLRSDAAESLPAASTYAWQVITFADPTDISVQRVSMTLDASNTQTAVLASPVDPSSTFLIGGATGSGAGVDIGSRSPRVHLSSPTGVEASRQAGGNPLTVEVQVIEMRDGTSVQHGTIDFAAGQVARTVTIDPVDPATTTVLSTVNLPGSVSGGSTDYIVDDVIGEASATFELTDPATVTLVRDATAAAASFGWQAIEWGGPGWWDPTYPFRQRIDITATTAPAPDAYTVPLTFDHAALVTAGLSLADGSDLRVLRWDGAAWVELDRVLDDGAAWNQPDTSFWFRTQDPVAADTTVSYWMYFGSDTPPPPLEDPENVFLLVEDFESGTLGDFEDRTGGTAWYRALPWDFRRQLVVPAAAVTQIHNDMAVLVQTTDAHIGSNARADGADIRFTAADGVTPLGARDRTVGSRYRGADRMAPHPDPHPGVGHHRVPLLRRGGLAAPRRHARHVADGNRGCVALGPGPSWVRAAGQRLQWGEPETASRLEG